MKRIDNILSSQKTIKHAEARTRYNIREIAKKKGWNVDHPKYQGNFLEENEITNYYCDIGLGQKRPDFLIIFKNNPVAVIEAKNESIKLKNAVEEACQYADEINKQKKYTIKIAIGAAGENKTGFEVAVYYKTLKNGWQPLQSNNAELTAIPTLKEIEIALKSNDGTTNVTVPTQNEFIDAAIELSSIMREAKIGAPFRPKVIGALVAAMYEGDIDIYSKKPLVSVNTLLKRAINGACDLQENKKKQMIDALELSKTEFNRLEGSIGLIVKIIKNLNIRAILHSNIDFLGIFYEAFLRYGYDNKSLGIVFTPRHITQFCIQLTNIDWGHKIIDIASGTGGFLVSAFDNMIKQADNNKKYIERIKKSLYGFEIDPTIWALASLNMFFRGDGKSHIDNNDCFDKNNLNDDFDRSYLNPPFSQKNEPEQKFIDRSIEFLKPGGLMAAVVKAGIFADNKNKSWRKAFLEKNTLLAIISLPDDLFYPIAGIATSIIVVKAHIPHKTNSVFMARIKNDGFKISKKKRIECDGEQLTEVSKCFDDFLARNNINSPLAILINGNELKDGQEWSPQQWLPQPFPTTNEINTSQNEVIRSLFLSVVQFPELANKTLPNFGKLSNNTNSFVLGEKKPLSYFFDIVNGKSSGENNYQDGDIAYISSGDTFNSIVRLVESLDDNKVFKNGAITVTAFGQAYVQPWPFLARGNGGSSVRILIPRFEMSLRELVWFASQINIQRWRFFFNRQAIKSRIEDNHFQIFSPKKRLVDDKISLSKKLQEFRNNLDVLCKL